MVHIPGQGKQQLSITTAAILTLYSIDVDSYDVLLDLSSLF